MKLYKVGEVAKEADVLPSTVRYYTDLGLIKPVKETKGGHKLYDEDAINKVKRIKALVNAGRGIMEIKMELKEKRILLVEDDPDAGSLIYEFLKNEFGGCKIEWVKDGFSAGRVIPDFLPDVVILDIMLPGVDGFKVCEKIKQDGLLIDSKVIAITGYDSKDVKDRILKAGADSYLPKPFELEDLKGVIKRFI